MFDALEGEKSNTASTRTVKGFDGTTPVASTDGKYCLVHGNAKGTLGEIA